MTGRSRRRRARLALVITAALGAPSIPAAAATLARSGQATVRIVLATDAIPAERTAARELASYLERVTSAPFSVVTEARFSGGVPAIWVGPTERARRSGIDAAALGPEQWRMVAEGDDLLLVGGRPRGTLYAVYRFLEDHVGVRWWTPYDESVPVRPDLEVEVDSGGRPTFAYRDVLGVRGSPVFHARNRANGHFSFLTAGHGGREAYGPPDMVHTFFQYLPPEAYFEDHPEFYAERHGERKGERSQLCLTSEALLEVVADKLRAYIEEGEAEAASAGERPPRLFDFSQNDRPRPCTCEVCREVDEREGSHAGSLVHFINRLADSVAASHPGVMIDTLAYDYTLRPPRDLRLRENVVVRFADLQYRDFSRPVRARANREVRRALEGWSRRSDHLRIWAYTVTFGRRAHHLPLPNLPVIAEDFRFYRDRGVEGLFVQHEYPVFADLHDLKAWVIFKLAEDPSRDLANLVREFTDGFYGPAGGTVRAYLKALESAARRKRSPIRYPTSSEQYRYLTPAFLRHAQALFDRAEREVAHDPRLRRRVRHARLSLDRATLLRWDERLAGEPRRSGAGRAIDPVAVAERLRRTAFEQIDLRIKAHRRGALRERVETEIAEQLARIGRRAAMRLPSDQETLNSPMKR